MDIRVIVNQVFILFLAMGVGFVANKTGIINAEVNKKLSELLLKIVSPFLVITSFSIEFSREMLINAVIVFTVAFAAHVISAILAYFVFLKFKEDEKKVYKYSMVFSNCAFMGFPVLESLFGKNGIFYGSIYLVTFTIFMWTYGVMLFTECKDLKTIKKAMKTPGIISVLIGMVIFVFQIKLPVPIYKTLEMIGSMNTPIAMLVIGNLLAGIDFKKAFVGKGMYLAVTMRILVVPIAAILIMKLVGLTGDVLGACSALVAMPVAANTAIFAEMYDCNAPLASRCVAISTLMSIFTIPLVIAIL